MVANSMARPDSPSVARVPLGDGNGVDNIYPVQFSTSPTEGTLGMIITPITDPRDGREYAMVSQLAPMSAAAEKGVTLGSIIKKVNEVDVSQEPHESVMETLRQLQPGPFTMMLEVPGPLAKYLQDAAQQCLVRKDIGPRPPRTRAQWGSKYLVLGGLLGNSNALQVQAVETSG
uniref:PDZ domain-containing protein n=1 Tax=Rhizochromulina marina TaxID=1034831 RepID=A0A7S2SR71_9STRA